MISPKREALLVGFRRRGEPPHSFGRERCLKLSSLRTCRAKRHVGEFDNLRALSPPFVSRQLSMLGNRIQMGFCLTKEGQGGFSTIL